MVPCTVCMRVHAYCAAESCAHHRHQAHIAPWLRVGSEWCVAVWLEPSAGRTASVAFIDRRPFLQLCRCIWALVSWMTISRSSPSQDSSAPFPEGLSTTSSHNIDSRSGSEALPFALPCGFGANPVRLEGSLQPWPNLRRSRVVSRPRSVSMVSAGLRLRLQPMRVPRPGAG